MTGKSPNRIAAEDISGLTTWKPPEVGSGGKVLASAEKEKRDLRQHDSEVIEDIDSEVSYTPMTAQELQAITEAAEKEGFERGYTEGFAKGETDGRRIAEESAERQAKEQLEAQVSALLQVAEALVEPIDEQQEALEKVLLSFVVDLTRQVVERELQLDSGQILGAVREAVGALPVGADNISIFLNPDDLALVETYAEEQGKSWTFRADTDLLAGGCRVESRDSLVDFSVEKRLDELFHQFLDKQLVMVGDERNDDAEHLSPAVEKSRVVSDHAFTGDHDRENT